MANFLHDPHAVLDYQIDWSAWLGTDAIVTSTWTVPTGLSMLSSTHGTTTATIWLTGGTAGTRYMVTNHIVTEDEREEDRSIYLKVAER